MPAAAPSLTLLVPCYREGARVDALVAAWRAWQSEHPGVRAELLCVDDGSPDDTAARLEAAGIRVLRLDENAGKGAALRAGFAEAEGEVLLFLDADLAVDLSHIDAALRALEEGAEIVVGSRAIAGAATTRSQGLVRRSLGGLYRALAVWWLDLDVSDVTCGFKAFRAPLGKALLARSRAARWGIDAELLYLARRAGHTIVEMPVRWRDGDASSVRVVRDGLGSLRELLAVRGRHGRAPAAAAAARVS